jgi:nucleoside-diphosphate-sugar epimerase
VGTAFHLAALVSVPQSVEDPAFADAVNIGGTLNLLLAARDAGVGRLVFSSSSAIYGDTDVVPTHEEVLPDPLSPYGIQKLASEHYARAFTRLYGLETVILRYFNVYGPRQNPASAYAAVIPKFVTSLLAGQAPTVFGDGEQTRDFCYVGDVVAANLLAAGPLDPASIGRAYNVAGGRRTSLNDLLVVLRDILHSEVAAAHGPERAGDIRHSGADIRRAASGLGFVPAVSLAEGLSLTVDDFRARRTGA